MDLFDYIYKFASCQEVFDAPFLFSFCQFFLFGKWNIFWWLYEK